MRIVLEKEPKCIIASGDWHGNFKGMVNKINDQYQIEDSIIIQCGDFGVGFNKPNFYNDLFGRLNKKLKQKNNILFALRGNHDNPEYFQDNWKLSNIKLVSDYSTIKTPSKNLLLVGGAISIDRSGKHRIVDVSYWLNEPFVFDVVKLDAIEDKITHVFTHSSPEECEPITKEGIMNYLITDSNLNFDINQERKNHSKLMNYLITKNHPVKEWYYGHFHYYKMQEINGIKFFLIDIDRLQDLKS